MRWLAPLVLLLVLIAPSPGAAQEPKTEDEKALYAIGLSLSDRLTPFGLTAAELEFVKAGLADGALGRDRKVDPRAYTAKIQALRQARATVVAEGEKKAGQAYPHQGRRRARREEDGLRPGADDAQARHRASRRRRPTR